MSESKSAHPRDRDLVRRLLAGEETAFDGFAEDYFGALFRFAMSRLGGDEDLAAEIVQTTLVTAFRKLESYRGDAALLTWLCGICRFEINAYFRRKGRTPTVVALVDHRFESDAHRLDSFSTDQSPAEELERKEVAQMVHRILDELPNRYGRTLEWKYLDGLYPSSWKGGT